MAKHSLPVAVPVSVAAGASVGCANMVSMFLNLAGTFTATYQAQESFDNGTTWINKGAALTAPGAVAIDDAANAVRWNCTAFTSGTPASGLVGLGTSQYDVQ